jgi:flavin-dependent dehydrogenase
MTTAVVLGGGFAGVLAAAVLRKHVDDVVTIESDHYPQIPGPRWGLPQSGHSHVLVTGGARALERLLPGTIEALFAHGAQRIGLPGDALILTPMGWFSRLRTESYLISCSRGLLDHVVRQQAAISVRERTQALGLAGNATRVTGVYVARENAPAEMIRADLVIDATGRRSKAPRWLAQLGVGQIELAKIDSGLASSRRLYRAPPELAADLPAIMLHPRPAKGRPGRGAMLFPIENDRFIVTLTGTRGDEPPGDEHGFAHFARSLPHRIVADLMAASTPIDSVRAYRNMSNRRRFFEQACLPSGFVAIGDALVAVNPSHSHGMAVAALSALRMDRELTQHGIGPGLQAAVAAEGETSWQMAIEQDAGQVHIDGNQNREMSPLERKIRARMIQATLSSPELAAEFFRAHMLTCTNTATDRSAAVRAMSRKRDPLLTPEEAIMQYPGLARWWLPERPRLPVAVNQFPGDDADSCAVPTSIPRLRTDADR